MAARAPTRGERDEQAGADAARVRRSSDEIVTMASSNRTLQAKNAVNSRSVSSGDLLGEVVARRQRASAHVGRDASPVVDRVEQPVDDALLAPQHEQRARHLAARGDVRRRRARGRSTPPRGSPRTSRGSSRDSRSSARTRRTRADRRMRRRRAPAARLLAQVVRRIGADHPLGHVERLDQEEPVVVGRGELEVGLAVHEPRGRDVEHARRARPPPGDRRTGDARRGRRGRGRRAGSAAKPSERMTSTMSCAIARFEYGACAASLAGFDESP